MANTKSSKGTSKDSRKQPVHEVRLGRIRAAIWLNESDNGPFYNVTIARLYKDGDHWKDSQSFSRDDLPLVAKVCDQVHTWIFRQALCADDNGFSDDDNAQNT